MEITLKMSEEQVQRILNIIGNASYREIADIIDTIKQQANEQIKKREDHL